MHISDYQFKVWAWVNECFGEQVSQDATERSFRFIEESLELVQSLGATKEEVLKLVDYVYSRDVGELEQEIGGVMVTLAALNAAMDICLEQAAIRELERVNAKIEKIRSKHFSKPQDVRSPIPGTDK
jgi:NTP pyrophosphatase (non-canonical NTP hydrolase)